MLVDFSATVVASLDSDSQRVTMTQCIEPKKATPRSGIGNRHVPLEGMEHLSAAGRACVKPGYDGGLTLSLRYHSEVPGVGKHVPALFQRDPSFECGTLVDTTERENKLGRGGGKNGRGYRVPFVAINRVESPWRVGHDINGG